MASFEVQEREVSLISPEKKLEDGHSKLPFTTFDIMQKRSSMPYLQRVCFFESKSGSSSRSSNESVIERMKASLAKVLVDFYPLAGRLEIQSEGDRPVISCSGAGVEFCVADANVSLEELDFSQPRPWFSKLIKRGNYEFSGLSTNIPFITIQVTEFRCGGVCVAWSYDHLVMDGTSQWQFMCSWSEICRGLLISRPPTHDRFFEQQHEQFSGISPTNSLSCVFEDVSIGMEAKIFEFDDETIQRLKLLSSATFSSFEVVASQVWIALCKAREFPASQKTSHQLPINLRSRLSTPLPAGYFGNCVLCALAESTAGELVTGGLPFTASVVHEAITSFKKDNILSTIATYNNDIEGSSPFSKGITDGVDTWAGSSPRFPMYSVDFGWGKPAAVRHAMKLWSGFCFYDPSATGGKAIEVTVFLPPETMAKFSEEVKTN